MPERWVINASPIILLAKIEHLHLLAQLPDDWVVPQAVIAEIEAGPADDPARLLLPTLSWPTVAVTPNPQILAWDLGAGESAVLSHALTQPGWKAVLDDGAARRCAHTFSIPLIGTLGVILRARRAGLIPAAVPLLQLLLSHDFRMDDAVIRRALQETVGEQWPD